MLLYGSPTGLPMIDMQTMIDEQYELAERYSTAEDLILELTDKCWNAVDLSNACQDIALHENYQDIIDNPQDYPEFFQ